MSRVQAAQRDQSQKNEECEMLQAQKKGFVSVSHNYQISAHAAGIILLSAGCIGKIKYEASSVCYTS